MVEQIDIIASRGNALRRSCSHFARILNLKKKIYFFFLKILFIYF